MMNIQDYPQPAIQRFSVRWQMLPVIVFVTTWLWLTPLQNLSFVAQGKTPMVFNSTVIEWTQLGGLASQPSEVADVTIYTDGRLRLGERFGQGKVTWHQLAPADLATLRRFVFEEQALMNIDPQQLQKEVLMADSSRLLAASSDPSTSVTMPMMDAGTTLMHAFDAGQSITIKFHDVYGHAKAYPNIQGIQRLRQVELYLLNLVQQHGQ
jgi:hypothetical protein